ncbi:MAG: protease inhibitor I42 family protein [Microthrixaceae bacterium]
MRRIIFILATVSTVALFGCSSDSSGDSTTSTTADDSSTTTTAASSDEGPVVTEPGPVSLEVGGRATLELAANPTTGYQWELAAEPDSSIVTIVSDTYVAPDSSAVGAGGTQRMVVEGVAPGTASIELRYVRPWETDAEPAETATFELAVS